MSRAYGADGKRLSAKTHATRTHPCGFCDASPNGNGGKTAHGRGHVRKGEAVEMVKHAPEGIRRVFVAPGDVQKWLTKPGYFVEETDRG